MPLCILQYASSLDEICAIHRARPVMQNRSGLSAVLFRAGLPTEQFVLVALLACT